MNIDRMKLLSSAVVLVSGVLVATGCQNAASTNHFVDIQPEPTIDTATEWRNWDPSVAHYPSTTTIAGPTGIRYEPTSSYDDKAWYAITPVPLLLGNLVVLPFTMIVTPPGTRIEYTPARTRDTFTAMPVLPDLRSDVTTTQPRTHAEPMSDSSVTPPTPSEVDVSPKGGDAVVPVVPLPAAGATPTRTTTPNVPSTRPAPPVGQPFPAPTTVPEMNKD